MANEREDEESEHSGRYRPTTAIKRTSAAIELMETQGRCMADLKKRYVKDKVCKGKAHLKEEVKDEGSGAGAAGVRAQGSVIYCSLVRHGRQTLEEHRVFSPPSGLALSCCTPPVGAWV